MIETDEGASYLGKVSLVPQHSPISEANNYLIIRYLMKTAQTILQSKRPTVHVLKAVGI